MPHPTDEMMALFGPVSIQDSTHRALVLLAVKGYFTPDEVLWVTGGRVSEAKATQLQEQYERVANNWPEYPPVP